MIAKTCAWALLLCSTLGCGTTTAIEEPTAPAPNGARDGGTPNSGRTGTVGATSCNDVDDPEAYCRARAESQIATLEEPAEREHELVESECVEASHIQPCSDICACRYAASSYSGADEWFTIYLGRPGQCELLGRDGDCLIHGNDVPGCDQEEEHSCAASCAALEAAYAQDNERTFEAELRAVRCDERYECVSVVRVDEKCVARVSGADLPPQVVDCTIPDEEILDWYTSQVGSEVRIGAGGASCQ